MAHPRTPSAEAQYRMTHTRPIPPAPGVVATAVELPVPGERAARSVTVRPSPLPTPFDRGFPTTMRPVLAGYDEETHGPVYVDADEPLPTPAAVDVLLNEFAYLEACVRDLGSDADPTRRHLVYLAFLRRHAQLTHVAAKCDIVHTHLVALRREQIQTLRLQLAADEADLARLERGRTAGFAALAHHVRQHVQQPSTTMRELQDLERQPLTPRGALPGAARSLVPLMHEAGMFASRVAAQRQQEAQGEPPSSPSIASPVGTPPSSPRRSRAPPRKGPPPQRSATGGKTLPPHLRYPDTGGKRPRPPPSPTSPPVPTPPHKRARGGCVIWTNAPPEEAASEAASEADSAAPSTPPPPPPLVLPHPVAYYHAALASRDEESDSSSSSSSGSDGDRHCASPAHLLPPGASAMSASQIPVNLHALMQSPLS